MVRTATGDVSDADIRAGLLSTYLLGTVLCRYILRLPPVVAMDADTLAASIAPLLQHFLTGSLTG